MTTRVDKTVVRRQAKLRALQHWFERPDRLDAGTLRREAERAWRREFCDDLDASCALA